LIYNSSDISKITENDVLNLIKWFKKQHI
jgi:hypothetical protein